jgi:hypothetical protein
MEDNQTTVGGLCRHCGSNQPDAAADARALGFEEEFASGIYTCCQVVQWADEQWLAWSRAAEEDGKALEEVMRHLEIREPSPAYVQVRCKNSQVR